MDVLVQWEFDHGSVGISTNDKIARTGAAFIIVDDLEAECRRLEGVGINADAPRKGDYSTLAAVHDPDSNLFTLASPLSRPYPPA
jgi:predicted enzyme related to lactoylglutathione lyase